MRKKNVENVYAISMDEKNIRVRRYLEIVSTYGYLLSVSNEYFNIHL